MGVGRRRGRNGPDQHRSAERVVERPHRLCTTTGSTPAAPRIVLRARVSCTCTRRDEGSRMAEDKPPLPPFTRETAAQKVQAAEDAWNTHDPDKVAQAYTVDSIWRNHDFFVTGREEIVAFLTQKWERELDYALRKNLWCFEDNRIAVRFQYESH